MGFSHNGYHTEITVAMMNSDFSAIVPEVHAVRVEQGGTASQHVYFFDPCGRYTGFSADQGQLTDNGDGTWTWSLETGGMSQGHYDINLQASDGAGSEPAAAFKLIINSDPVMHLLHPLVTVEIGETASNIITTEDFDGDPVSVALSFSPGTLSQNPDGTWTWSFPTEGMEPGMHFVALEASDGFGGTSQVSFPVKVARIPTQQEIDTRIGSGIDWLAGQQYPDGSWKGPYPVIPIDAPVTATGLALTKLSDFAREQGLASPLDGNYIHADRVEAGLAYLLGQARTWGNMDGVYFNADAHPFSEPVSTAAAMMGFYAATHPSMTVDHPANPDIHGLSYLELMQLMVDYLALVQEGTGSWGGNSSTTGQVAYALIYAEAFGCHIPVALKDKLLQWIAFIQRDDGSAGYDHPASAWPEHMAMTNTANLMVAMALAEMPPEDVQVQKALDYISYLWSHPEEDHQWGERNVEVLFTMMKAFMSYSIETLEVDGEQIDWYEAFATELIFFKPQGEEGFWIFSWGGDRLLNTSWALLTLERTYPEVVADVIPPAIVCPEDLTLECDISTDPEITGRATATDNMDPEPTVDFADEILPGSFSQQFTIIRTWTATDAAGNTASCVQSILVVDTTPPLISGLPADITLESDPEACGAAVYYPGIAATDLCQEVPILQVEPPSGSFFPVGQHSVVVTAADDCGNTSTSGFLVTVTNDLPLIHELHAPADPVAVHGTVNVSAEFLDNNPDVAIWDWGDGSSSEGVIGTRITGSHVYETAGMYRLTCSLFDLCGENTARVYEYIVVTDPSMGFVTGGGWINSPAGACTLYPDATGKANFGFVSKYKKGAAVPSGNTEFQFKAGDLNFHSKTHDWLVVTGSKAIFKGMGTVNGAGNYSFMISVIDGDILTKGGEDKLRMRIWDPAYENAIVYDNQMGYPGDADPLTGIGKGSIVIHSNAKFKSAGVLAGNEAESLASRIEISPNPFSGSAFIHFRYDADTNLIIRVYNMAGKLMQHLYSGSIQEGLDYSFELKAQPGMDAGTYLIHFVMGEDVVITRQVILQK